MFGAKLLYTVYYCCSEGGHYVADYESPGRDPRRPGLQVANCQLAVGVMTELSLQARVTWELLLPN
jgi:hypothetical protein